VPRARARSAEAVLRDGSRAAKNLPYADLYYMATNAYGNGIYLLDAYPQSIFKTTQKYNPQTDVWTSVKKIPTYRATSSAEQAAVAVTVGSGIYVLGGGAPPNLVRQRHEVYSPLSDAWTTKKAIPVGSGAAGAGGGSCGSTVVFGGGYPAKDTFSLYNTATDLWAAGEHLLRLPALRGVRCQAAARSAGPNLPISVQFVASFSKGNSFYVAGGETPPSVIIRSVYMYDCNAGTWTTGNGARRARPCRASARLGGSAACAAPAVQV
jgi:hypothetical protein